MSDSEMAGPACVDCAHAMPLVFYRRGESWVPAAGHPLIRSPDGQSFAEFAGMLASDPPRQLRCSAPQLDGLMPGVKPSLQCNAVRSLYSMCGEGGRWFVMREGWAWSYQSNFLPDGNSGQTPAAAQAAQPGAPEH